MMADTKILFATLLQRMDIDCVCDVGSMDGSESLIFRKRLPDCEIFAFEANPKNFGPMEANPELQKQRIQVVTKAVSNHNGEADFFVVDADYSAPNDQRGMSSLYSRGPQSKLHSTVTVPTTRLDSFLSGRSPRRRKLAVWLDVEGKAFEVLEGAEGLMHDQLCLLHVEAETYACISPDQKLYGDIKALLERNGFLELACDGRPQSPQLNLIFVRKSLPFSVLASSFFWAIWFSIRFHLRRAKYKLLR